MVNKNSHRFTDGSERATVWQHINSAQDLLAESLGRELTQQTLADHLSLDGFAYAAALFTLSQTLASMAIPPARLDPLAPSGDVVNAVTGASLYSPKASRAQQMLCKIANDHASTLNIMLWPPCALPTVCAPYKVPANSDENLGDGRFRPTELAKYENQPPPASDRQDTLDGVLLANLLAGASLDSALTANGKNISAALISYYENLQGAVETALAAIEAPRNAAGQATADAATSRTASAQANDRLKRTRETLGANARPVNVTLHGRGIQQLRSMLPNTFGPAYFMRRGQVTQNYYLFGLEDLPTRQAVSKTFYGEFLDSRGQLLGSTDRSRMPTTGVETAEHLVLVIPRNHSTAKLLSNMNRQINATQQAGATAAAAEAERVKARSALNDAINHHGEQSRKAATWRFLNSRPFPAAVLMLEMWNVKAEVQSKEKNIREKGELRTVGGAAGSYIDLLIAMEALTVKLVGSQSAELLTRKTVYEISDKAINRWLGSALGEVVTKELSIRLMVQTVGGLVFAALNLYDAWYAWQWNDQAMYGYLLMAGGALSGAASGLLSGMTPVLGLNPLGWLSLLLIGVGTGLVYWLSSTPLEDWLNAGPFGTKNGSATQHLQDPQEAFYRLIGLLAGISISIQRNPRYQPNAKLDDNAADPYQIRSANTLIRLESRLPGLLGSLGSPNIQAECRLCETVTLYSLKGSPYRTDTRVPTTPTAPLAQRPYLDGLELYFSTPPAPATRSHTESRGWHWAVRAQFILGGNGETRYFPAPGVKDPTRYGPANAKADFRKTDQPFWADEQTHKASSHE